MSKCEGTVNSDSCTRYIFVTGGVCSSLGKGVAAATIGALLQSMNFRVSVRKLDPYLNIDTGTMSPIQHGEVFVTDDGMETDLDLGHYERFTGNTATSCDSVTAGKIYDMLLKKERKGDYLGKTVQVIPHVTDLIKSFILSSNNNEDFIVCEIGGTVGDIEGLPFIESIRQIRYELGKEKSMFIHLTFVPYISVAGELKTKPTQHSVRELNHIGVSPDIILCRSEIEIPSEQKEKIAQFCNVKIKNVIAAIDLDNIYKAPISYYKCGLDSRILEHFSLEGEHFGLEKWENIVKNIESRSKIVNIAIVGKYVKVIDSYKSLVEALFHAGLPLSLEVNVELLDSKCIDAENVNSKLRGFDAIIVPGGFGSDGILGKIEASKYARENNIPFLGICVGMQVAVIEFARNVIGISNASSEEITPSCVDNVIILIKEDSSVGDVFRGSMRLGAYNCILDDGSKIAKIYSSNFIRERHRHRYTVNTKYLQKFKDFGMIASGVSENGEVEVMELINHRWFVSVQFHPEFKSRPFEPSPLFVSFLQECSKFVDIAILKNR